MLATTPSIDCRQNKHVIFSGEVLQRFWTVFVYTSLTSHEQYKFNVRRFFLLRQSFSVTLYFHYNTYVQDIANLKNCKILHPLVSQTEQLCNLSTLKFIKQYLQKKQRYSMSVL